jgi:hypothetical protein
VAYGSVECDFPPWLAPVDLVKIFSEGFIVPWTPFITFAGTDLFSDFPILAGCVAVMAHNFANSASNPLMIKGTPNLMDRLAHAAHPLWKN